jgi:hypothetical protein
MLIPMIWSAASQDVGRVISEAIISTGRSPKVRPARAVTD